MTWKSFLFDLGINMLHIYSIICNWINGTKQAIAVAVGYSFKLTVNMQDTLDKERLTPEIQTITLHKSSSTISLGQHDVINNVFPFYSGSFAQSGAWIKLKCSATAALAQHPCHRWSSNISGVQLCCRWDQAGLQDAAADVNAEAALSVIITSCLTRYFSRCDAEAPWFPDLYCAHSAITTAERAGVKLATVYWWNIADAVAG